MISVVNPLQPLNGNKKLGIKFVNQFNHLFKNNMKYLILLLALLSFSLCDAQRQRNLYSGEEVLRFDSNTDTSKVKMKESNESIQIENKEKVNREVKATEVIPTDDVVSVKEKDTAIIRKEVYNVALILPFNAGAGWGAMSKGITMIRDSSAKTASIPRETKISIDFYNGVRMAIADASNANVKIQFYVYDDLKNIDQTTKLLQDTNMAKMDVIIGPAHTQNAVMVANFCKEHHIYNFSPLSPSIYIANTNPYHFKLNPSTEMLCKAMVDKLVADYEYGSVLVLGRNTEDDRHYASIVYDYVQELNKNKADDKKLFCDTLIVGNASYSKSLSSMYTGNHSIVICPSFNEGYITATCAKVSSTDKVTFYGMPTWLDYDAVNYNTMNESKPYIPKVVYADTSDAEDKRIVKGFRENHGYAIEENTLLGYDIMQFTIYALEQFGLSLKDHVADIDYKGLFSNYKFVPVKYFKADNTLPYDMYENNQVHFLEFRDFDLQVPEIKD